MNNVKSASRILDLLELLSTSDGAMRLTEVVRALGIPKSSAHALLQTLVRRGYAEKDSGDRYAILPEFREGFGWVGGFESFLRAVATPIAVEARNESGETIFVGLPHGNPFTDPLVREALDIAIDRETMVEVVLEGLGKPATQGMPPGFFGYNDTIGVPEFDPARAKALLAEAGYPDGFQMDLYCSSDRLPGDGAICQGLGQMFSAIGVDTNVNAITRTVFFPAQARGDYSISMGGWGTLTGEAAYTLSSQMHTKNDEIGMGAYNRSSYSNPELDALIQAGSVELDEDKRRAIFEEAMKMARETRVLVPVVQLQTVWAAKAGALDFAPRIDQDTLAYGIHAR